MSVHSLPPMKNPPHPGALVREDVINELGLTIAGAAELLDVSHPNLSLFLHERIDLSPETALKLEAAFGLEPAMLLAMQTDRNLSKAREWQAEITGKIRAVKHDSKS